MEIMISLNEKEEDAITKKDREVEKKEGCGNPVMSCLQVWKTSQQEGIEAAVGPHVRFLQGSLENQDPHCPANVWFFNKSTKSLREKCIRKEAVPPPCLLRSRLMSRRDTFPPISCISLWTTKIITLSNYQPHPDGTQYSLPLLWPKLIKI